MTAVSPGGDKSHGIPSPPYLSRGRSPRLCASARERKVHAWGKTPPYTGLRMPLSTLT